MQAAKGPGDDVRAIGSDIEAGATVLQRGDLVGPAEVGILATVGATTVPARPCLRVQAQGFLVPATVAPATVPACPSFYG